MHGAVTQALEALIRSDHETVEAAAPEEHKAILAQNVWVAVARGGRREARGDQRRRVGQCLGAEGLSRAAERIRNESADHQASMFDS